MNNNDFLITINNNTTFEEFKNIAKQYFKFIINDNIKIHYFNTFGLKIYVTNEFDFKNSMAEKVFKNYFTDKFKLQKKKIELNKSQDKLYQAKTNFNDNSNYISKSPEPFFNYPIKKKF